jgi:exopolysaccharide biosynthesis polyprenyl glycosylphosphotransferase
MSSVGGAAVSTTTDSGQGALALDLARATPSAPIAALDPPNDKKTPVAVVEREGLYRRMLALADVLAAVGALGFSTAVMGNDSLRWGALAMLPVVVLVSKVVGLYDRDELVLRKTTLDEAPAMFQVAGLYALLVWLLQANIVEGHLSRYQVLGMWGSLFVAFLVARTAARRIARMFTPPERCLVVGSITTAEMLRRKFALDASTDATIVGCLPLGGSGDREPLVALAPTVDELDVHRVIVAPQQDDPGALLEVIGRVKQLGVRVSVLPRIFEVVGSSVEFDLLGGITLLGVRRFGLTRSSRILKRALDVAIASTLLLLVFPLLAALALAIKLQSAGPVLFRQTRIGRDGRPFTLLKFRSMVDDAEAQKPALAALNAVDGLFKIPRDPRTTPIGRLMRKASLDELPQVINVLRGEMSLVGPRPLVPDEDRQVHGWHRRRLQLPPGLTGPWQVLGPVRIPLPEMATIDYLYAANWSLWLDVKLLLRTVPHVLAGRGI